MPQPPTLGFTPASESRFGGQKKCITSPDWPSTLDPRPLTLVGGDLVCMCQRACDVVEPVQQRMAPAAVDLKACIPTAGAVHRTLFEVHGELAARPGAAQRKQFIDSLVV